MSTPTFQCTFCGAPINGAAPGQTVTCMYCRANVRAPMPPGYGPSSRRSGADGAEWDDDDDDEDDAGGLGPFANGIYGVAATYDAELGLVVVGAHVPAGAPAVLRAIEVKSGRVLWDALAGQKWVERVREEHLAIIGKNVYVANKRQLVCLDLVRGTQKWVATLSDEAAVVYTPTERLAVADPFPPGQRGAILVPTVDNHLFAFDRDSGQALWSRTFGDKSIEAVTPVEGLGACLVAYGAPYVKVDVVNPAYPQPIASLGHDHWSTDLGLARLSGRTVVTVADDMGGDGDDDGLLCFDAVTGQRHFFDPHDDLECDDVNAVAMGQRVFAATSGGEGLYIGPRGRTLPVPIPNHAIATMIAAGPTLVLLLRKARGTSVRRIVGLDPNTGAFRFDAGEAGDQPDDEWERQIATDGHSVVFVASEDLDDCELRSIDTSTGRPLWRKNVGAWRAHRFVGGVLLVWSDSAIVALAPSSGAVLAELR